MPGQRVQFLLTGLIVVVIVLNVGGSSVFIFAVLAAFNNSADEYSEEDKGSQDSHHNQAHTDVAKKVFR